MSLASLSLDLDDAWTYLKTRGDDSWRDFPSYLERVVPRLLDLCASKDLRISVFVVGQDAALPKNAEVLAGLGESHHEIGNHSFHHEPWLHLRTDSEITTEITEATEAIVTATGRRPKGFRGPGYSFSPATLVALSRAGYRYDASTIPTFIGPLARTFFMRSTDMTEEDWSQRRRLYGSFSEGFRPLRPYRWKLEGTLPLLEIPVTTMPLVRLPIHTTYLIYLARYSEDLARGYLRFALMLCRLTGVEPSFLLHSHDLVGGDEVETLDFLPGMDLPGDRKRQLMASFIDILGERHRIVSMEEHADSLELKPLRALAP